MLTAGDRAPETAFLADAGQPVGMKELYSDGPVVLAFYVLAFSGSLEGG